MIINPNDSELETTLKKWDERLKERQAKLVDLEKQYQTESQAFKAESEMMNDELSKLLDLPVNEPVQITTMLLKAMQKK